MVLLRFAPSPTGALHLGGLRTALYNHLYAKKYRGKWILRIEDTDSTRYVPGAVEGIRAALEWTGLEYDYGPGRDGPHSPYYQSERLDLYRTYARRLLESGHAYRCFCSPDKLASTRERLARTGSNATYDKACLHLTEEEVVRRVRAGESSIVRFNDDRLPQRDAATDLVFGVLRDAHASLPTDPVLLKSDLFPTYHLASIVDDHEMGITHVLRGEEWLPSLPLHLDLYASLSLKPPQFAHLPILLNPDGTKMSKRKGNVSVLDFMRRGWEPEALLNWLALAGWGTQHDPNKKQILFGDSQAPDSTAVMTLPELVDQFDLSALTHRRNILDPAKLGYLNRHHLMRSWKNNEATARHAHRIRELVKSDFPTSQYATPDYIAKVIRVLQGRITNVFDVPSLAPFFFVDPNYASPEAKSMLRPVSSDEYLFALETAIHFAEHILAEDDISHVAAVIHDACKATGFKQKTFMVSLRHALSAMKTGPSIPEIISVLGRERTIARLRNAISTVTGKI
ncbi:hypothetical protein BKA83DRAFT_4293667 [Pisolithus microcarpus]|nr:hypothetical protein BKA83DRAFT_4293667 [Pisolithus microcarpus]